MPDMISDAVHIIRAGFSFRTALIEAGAMALSRRMNERRATDDADGRVVTLTINGPVGPGDSLAELLSELMAESDDV